MNRIFRSELSCNMMIRITAVSIAVVILFKGADLLGTHKESLSCEHVA